MMIPESITTVIAVMLIVLGFCVAFALVLPIVYTIPKHPVLRKSSVAKLPRGVGRLLDRYWDYWLDKESEWEKE